MKNNFKLSLYLNYFVFAILLNSVGIVILKAQNFYHVNELKASALEFFKDMPIAIFSFISASFLPKLGYKKAMLIGIAAVCLGCISMAFLGTHFWMAKVLFAVIGASFALIKISVYSSIGMLSDQEKDHHRLMSNIEGTFMLGIAIAYFLFPAFNKQEDPTAWLRVYLFLAGISFISFIFLFFSKAQNVEIKNTSSLKENFFSMIHLVKSPLVIAFVLSTFLFVMIEQSIMTWLPTFNEKILHLNENLAIMMASILAISLGMGRIIAGYLVKFFSWFKVLSFCILIAMLGVFFILPRLVDVRLETKIASLKEVPFFGYSFPFIGLFIAPIYPLINSVILSSLPNKVHVHMSGLIIIFSAIGGVIGSRLTGFLFKAIGGANAFYYTLIPMSLLLLTLFILYKKSNKNKINSL